MPLFSIVHDSHLKDGYHDMILTRVVQHDPRRIQNEALQTDQLRYTSCICIHPLDQYPLMICTGLPIKFMYTATSEWNIDVWTKSRSMVLKWSLFRSSIQSVDDLYCFLLETSQISDLVIYTSEISLQALYTLYDRSKQYGLITQNRTENDQLIYTSLIWSINQSKAHRLLFK